MTKKNEVLAIDVFYHFQELIEGLEDDTAYGIVIQDAIAFVQFLEGQSSFKFEKGSDFYIEENDCNLWGCKIDGFPIYYVCCKNWVITFKKHHCSLKKLAKLVNIQKNLMGQGIQCSIKVLTKTCSCS